MVEIIRCMNCGHDVSIHQPVYRGYRENTPDSAMFFEKLGRWTVCAMCQDLRKWETDLNWKFCFISG
jgi:DNA-directed RNA polymerase subunit N (RpoN/RPB10)